MICKKCGSSNVNVQVVNDVVLKDKHHGILWWIFIGWWWVPVKWIFFTGFALLFKLFGHKKQVAVNKHRTVCVCNNCGRRWYL